MHYAKIELVEKRKSFKLTYLADKFFQYFYFGPEFRSQKHLWSRRMFEIDKSGHIR